MQIPTKMAKVASQLVVGSTTMVVATLETTHKHILCPGFGRYDVI